MDYQLFEKLIRVTEAKHSHAKCMDCSSPPEIEILWAEGRAHAWFCMKHLKKWATTGDGWHDVDAAKKVQDGEAAKKWGDNTSPNIVDTLGFLKEARVKEDSRQDLAGIKEDEERYIVNSFLDRKEGSTQYPNNWPVMPAARVIRIWNDYAKEGMVRDEKGINQLANILHRAIMRLEVATEIRGQSSKAKEFFDENAIDIGEFTRWSRDKGGSSILSDYAWKELTPLNIALYEAVSPEDKLQLIDRILNVVHQRGDLAKYFIEGSIKTLDRLAGTEEFVKEAKEVTDKEKLDFYRERTSMHIGLVQAAAAKIVDAYPEEFAELNKEAEDHDASKLEEPEMTPYIDITWRHKLEKEKGEFDPIKGKGYQTPGKLEKKEEDDATLHHIRNAKHHPEYWLEDKAKANLGTNRDDSIECVDASKMPDMAVAEMISDWQAMSEELQTNSAREWFNKVEDERWHFSDEQKELIDRLLKVFE